MIRRKKLSDFIVSTQRNQTSMSDEKILMKDNSEDEEKEEEEKMNHDDNDILMRSLLLDSVKREKNLQRLLDNEILKNDQLRMELELERKKKKDVILKGFKLNFI